ncbi:hypothetical protein N9F76_00720 [bacterium]|nr:hypothetical protein [bacterium]MDB4695161.1 hypothetical protein [bacterium]
MQCPKCNQNLDAVWLDLDQGEYSYISFSVLDMKEHERKQGFFARLFISKKSKHYFHKVYSREGFYCSDCEFVMFNVEGPDTQKKKREAAIRNSIDPWGAVMKKPDPQ